MASYQNLRLERHDDTLATLTLDRPPVNALDAATLDELADCVSTLAADATLRVLVVTGAGRAFVAGADIEAMSRMSVDEARAFSRKGHDAFLTLERAPFVTIAAVNGFALGGGCELALACDVIYASEKAVFGQPEVSLGLIPGFGGTQRLSRAVGLMVARDLVLSGRNVKADEALRIGLAAQVFAADEFAAKVHEAAATIARKAPRALSQAKAATNEGFDLPLDAAIALEVEAFAGMFALADTKEGMQAFLEKRQPTFRGA